MTRISAWRVRAAVLTSIACVPLAIAADLTYELPARPPGFAEPRVIKRTHVPYPTEELARKSSGTVLLDFHVLADGSVGDVKVTGHSGVPAFDEAVSAAARDWRFIPGKLDGKPAAMFHHQESVALNPLDAEEWTRLGRLHLDYHRAIHVNEVLTRKCAAVGFDVKAAQAAATVDSDLQRRAERLEARLYDVLEQLGRSDARTAVPASLARMRAKIDSDLDARFAGWDRTEKITRCKATLMGMLASGPGIPGELYEF